VNRIDVIRSVVTAIGAGRYLEIGVKDGECFHAIEVPTRVAVDPRFAFRPPLAARARTILRATTGSLYFPMTSDAFFERHARRLTPFDVVFVDGLHTYDQSYRDIVNALDVLREDGVVVVHDCNPASAAAAAPSLELAGRTDGWAGDWNGDVYKAIVRLRTRDDLSVAVLDCDHGVGIVLRGDPTSQLRLSQAEIDALEYEDLAADRDRLLGLTSPAALRRLVGLDQGANRGSG
jgi:hypothetical protein